MTDLSPAQAADALRRFATFVSTDGPTDCWIWMGALDSDGYGNFTLLGRSTGAHRASYTLQVGPIPAGLEIDHLCFNRRCVKPEHLEPVSHQENSRRRSARLTACKWGHAFDEANTYYRNGKRNCRACVRNAQAKRRRRLA